MLSCAHQVLIKLKTDLQQFLEKAAAAERVAVHSSAGGSSSSSGASSSGHDVPHADETRSSSLRDKSSQAPAEIVEEIAEVGSDTPAAGGRTVLDSDHPFANVAIWQLPVMPLFFEADRPAAKQLAKELMAVLKA